MEEEEKREDPYLNDPSARRKLIKSISPPAQVRNTAKSPIMTSGRVNRPWMQKKNEGFFKNSPNEDIVLAK